MNSEKVRKYIFNDINLNSQECHLWCLLIIWSLQTLHVLSQVLFRLEQPHGNGDLYIAWQNGSGNYLATTGLDSTVNIFDRYGQIKERIRLQRYNVQR